MQNHGFDWGGFLRLARLMRNRPYDDLREATLRTVVGRAYYATFNIAMRRAALADHKIAGDVSDHLSIQRYSKGNGYRREADMLRELRIMRNLCNHHDDVIDLEPMAERAISLAGEVCRMTRGDRSQ
jgi:hypothetical protein